MPSFLDRLTSGPAIVADGGMGAIVSGAVSRLRCPEEANLRAPESVVALHASFIRAGAELIETNTFGANRRKLAAHFLENDLEAINSAGVRLAREARDVSGREVFVAGSIGPLGELESFNAAEHGPLYAEQAAILDGRGVDLFAIETFFDVDELVVAVEAVRGISALPILALLTFDEDGETVGGVGAREAAERLSGLDVAAIGTNHGAGPHAALTALARMGDGHFPLVAMPNVGLASVSGGRVVYPHSSPSYFTEFAAQARSLGARIVGGCCGTTPAQIEAIRERARRPSARRARRSSSATASWPSSRPRTRPRPASPRRSPPATGSPASSSTRRRAARTMRLLAVARTLKESGRVGFVDINDNPMARARMNALMASIAIERELRPGDDPARDPARHERDGAGRQSCSARMPKASATCSQ